jgi:hypothetical protein
VQLDSRFAGHGPGVQSDSEACAVLGCNLHARKTRQGHPAMAVLDEHTWFLSTGREPVEYSESSITLN